MSTLGFLRKLGGGELGFRRLEELFYGRIAGRDWRRIGSVLSHVGRKMLWKAGRIIRFVLRGDARGCVSVPPGTAGSINHLGSESSWLLLRRRGILGWHSFYSFDWLRLCSFV